MSDRKLFNDSITPLPEHLGLTPQGLMLHAAEPQSLHEKMSVHFSMSTPANEQAKLEALVARGETVDPKSLASEYSPAQKDVDALVSWLGKQGFQNIAVSKDRTSVYADASASQIQKALAVDMVRVTRGGRTYTSARNAPSLPIDVGANVHAIVGLQPFRQMNKHFRMRAPLRDNRIGLGEALDAPQAPSANLENAPPYFVSEILKAYGADNLDVSGKGQTIAILIDTFPAASDLEAFWKHNGLPSKISRIQKVNVKGGHVPAREGEETLDAAWASGIASDATIRIYASGSLSFVDLDRALDRIIDDLPSIPGMRQLSISLGLGEKFLGGPQGEVAIQHQKFLRLAAAGVNVFVSSGDAGSNPDETGHGFGTVTQAEYECSDSCVVGVGGTTLRLAVNGDVEDEVAWPSSGGGKSAFFARPSWQQGAGIAAGSERLVPDVALAGDPDTGAFLVFQGKITQIGGTSWSAPVWAGFCALINEAREKANLPFLPFLNPLLYPLQGSACFRDISSGSNGAFSSGPGHDLVTGLGVPNVRELIRALTR